MFGFSEFYSVDVEGRIYKPSSGLQEKGAALLSLGSHPGAPTLGLLLVPMLCPAVMEKLLGKAWCLPIQVTSAKGRKSLLFLFLTKKLMAESKEPLEAELGSLSKPLQVLCRAISPICASLCRE